MTDAMRSMLDELMGKERDVRAEEKKRTGLVYSDPEVCKYAMVGLCPYQLFKNTKSDLGPCGYEVHEDHIEFNRLKKEYDAAPSSTRNAYSRDLLAVLDQLVKEMDRKIARAKERVEQENKPRAIKAADQAKLDALKQQEKECLERSEAMAMDGDADGSMAMAEAAEKFKEQAVKLHEELVTPDRTMSVCEICGVFINSTDNEQRRMDHINGKQYVGWKKIREKLEELQAEAKAGLYRESHSGHDRMSRERPAMSERDRYHESDHRGRDADRHGYRDSDRYHRDRDRERARSYERDRSDRRYGGRDYERRYGGSEVAPPSSYRRDDVRLHLHPKLV